MLPGACCIDCARTRRHAQVSGLKPSELAALDFFEDDEYTRQLVDVEVCCRTRPSSIRTCGTGCHALQILATPLLLPRGCLEQAVPEEGAATTQAHVYVFSTDEGVRTLEVCSSS